MATAATDDLAKATADLVAATDSAADKPAESEETTLVKSLVDVIDRLTKGDFGNPAAAHNGNKLDQSAPMGGGDVSGGYESTSAEENRPEASGRVSTSASSAKSSTPATPKTLTKGDQDEDSDDDDDDKKKDKKKGDDDDDDDNSAPFFAKKSQEALTEERIYKALTTDEGSEEYIPIAEASDAIQYQADTFAKGFAWLSAQFTELSKEVHGRLDRIEKSQGIEREAITVLVKSAKFGLAPLAKSEATTTTTTAAPASGVVIVNTGGAADTKTGGVADKGAMFKSISKAIQEERLKPEVGTRLLERLDTQGPVAVWDTIPEHTRKAILGEETK